MRFFSFLLVLSTLSVAKMACAEEVELAYFSLSPHIYKNSVNGQPSGIMPIFLHKFIAPEMGVKFKLINIPLARTLLEMEKGSLAGAAVFGYTKERALRHQYPRNYFSQMIPAIAVNKSNPLDKINKISDISHLNIGYVNGAILTPFIKDRGLKIITIGGSNTWTRNLQNVVNGRLDATFTPLEVNIIHSAKKMGVLDKIKVLRLPEPPIKLYTMFSKAENYSHLKLAERYDLAFEKINGRKVYRELMVEYLNEASQ